MTALTQLLDAAAAGDPKAPDELLPLVYEELRKLAAARLAAENPGQTLQATALVHEAYLRVVASRGGDAPGSPHWNGRAHFFGAAAEAMRRILIEAARRKRREKHGGGRHRLDLDAMTAAPAPDDDLLALNDALDELAKDDPAKAELVKLRYFAGLTLEEAAACQAISLATAKRRWAVARAWLYDALKKN
ncbi:MAG: ECF-type sigma factor [Gemmataceae bacterium]